MSDCLRVVRWHRCLLLFFFNDTATTEIYTLSLHDALPISDRSDEPMIQGARATQVWYGPLALRRNSEPFMTLARSEEHTSELQSRQYLVCRLLLEKKKNNTHLFSLYTSISSRFIPTLLRTL